MDFLLHFGPSHYNDLFRCDEPFFSRRGKGDVSEFVKKYKESYEKSERKGLICIPSGNHDMDRLARFLSEDEIKIAFAFLLSMPGAPFIYYGDEIGMRYVEGLSSVEGGYGRTGSRSPMQWDDTKNAGFSKADEDKLYISQDSDPDRPTVKKSMEDVNSIFNEIKRLIEIRRSHKALQSKGEIEFICYEKNAYPLVFIRSHGQEKIMVIINPSDKPASFKSEYALGDAVYTLGEKAYENDGVINVPPCSAGFYKI